MAKAWKGWLLDGLSSRRQAVKVSLAGQGVLLKAGRHVQLWPYAEIRQEQGSFKGEPVRLERGGSLSEALVVEDPAFLEALQAWAPRGGASRNRARLHSPWIRLHWGKLVAGSALASVLFALALHFWIIPSLASAVAARVPIAWEKKLSESALEIMVPRSDRRRSPLLEQAVKGMVERLAAAAPDSGYEFRVLLSGDSMANAFALPGGTLVLTRGLLEKMNSPEELAGVLAHEMQHVIRRHGVKHLIEQSQLALLLTLVSGDASGVILGAQAAANLAALSYSRADESEADALGMRMMCRAGLDPKGMIRAFEALKEEEDRVPEALRYLSTHLDTAGRIVKLKEIAAERPCELKAVRLPAGKSWKELRDLGGGFKPRARRSQP